MAIFSDLFPAKHRDHRDEGTSEHDETSMRRRRHRHRDHGDEDHEFGHRY
ncbi:hypothetical protein [Streptomyces hygroscopicus]|nr:hypothetical protein [Streptomyces hygroscopicus]